MTSEHVDVTKVVKRWRGRRGNIRHFVPPQTEPWAPKALCGVYPTGSWRGSERLIPMDHDCPRCVDRFIKLGGQFIVGIDS